MKPSCVHSVPAGALGSVVAVDEDDPGCEVLVMLDVGDEVFGDCVVEVDELCCTMVVGVVVVDEFGDSVVGVDGVCFSVVTDVGELLGAVVEVLMDSGFCRGVDSLVGDV